MYMDVESITWARAMLKHMYLSSGSYNADTMELLTLSLAQVCTSCLTAYDAHIKKDCSMNINCLQLSLVQVYTS